MARYGVFLQSSRNVGANVVLTIILRTENSLYLFKSDNVSPLTLSLEPVRDPVEEWLVLIGSLDPDFLDFCDTVGADQDLCHLGQTYTIVVPVGHHISVCLLTEGHKVVSNEAFVWKRGFAETMWVTVTYNSLCKGSPS